MKHCIIAKFNESAADKQAALAQVRALLSGAEEALLRIIKATKKSSSIVFVGLPIMRDGLIYDCAAVVSGGSLLGILPVLLGGVPHFNSNVCEKRR